MAELFGGGILLLFYQRFNGIFVLGVVKILCILNHPLKHLVCLHAQLCLKLDLGSSTTEKIE